MCLLTMIVFGMLAPTICIQIFVTIDLGPYMTVIFLSHAFIAVLTRENPYRAPGLASAIKGI